MIREGIDQRIINVVKAIFSDHGYICIKAERTNLWTIKIVLGEVYGVVLRSRRGFFFFKFQTNSDVG